MEYASFREELEHGCVRFEWWSDGLRIIVLSFDRHVWTIDQL
jgi:hypothetical protein